jgi:putative nucleotidyltransferase with HDIG domain
MGERDLRFRVYAWITPAVAAGLIVVTWSTAFYAEHLSLLLTLAVAVLVSELMAVDLPNGGSFSLTYPLGVCAVVLLGPTGAAGMAVLSLAPSVIQRGRTSPLKIAFNLGQVALTFVVPAWAYQALGGTLLLSAGASNAALSSLLLPLVVAATLGIVVNFALGGLGYAMIHDLSFAQVWREAFSWTAASQVALGLLGLAIAQVMATEGPLGFALFVVPLVVARQTHSRYLSLREAYADTVRSLVAAIEAKDPYTKGHSVRVARFAVAIAESMGLDEVQAKNIEYAALLHDLGKIGISRAVLAKSGALTDEEYGSIQEHPAIGARILESVPFLDSVRPAVQDHHERVDGQGYGRGLGEADLSIEAKVLAVADSYDAMTADRPYRSALSAAAAVAELRANSDTQFDRRVVEAFLAILPGIERADAVLAGVAQGGVVVAEA